MGLEGQWESKGEVESCFVGLEDNIVAQTY